MSILRITPFILLWLLSTAAWSVAPPGHFPERFPQAGTLDGIDLQAMTLIVSDTLQHLSPVVRVHDRSGSTGTLLNLREGMEIGYRTSSPAARGAPISEIWILPNGYLESQRSKQRY